MRIAMVSTPFVRVPPVNYGGTELMVYELVEGLFEQGHDVTLFGTGDSLTRAKTLSLYDKPQWPPDAITELNHCSWAMARIGASDFDLVHVHCAAALAMGRLVPDLPMVYTIHHERTEILSSFYSDFPETCFVTISHSQRKLEVPLPRCEVIHHGLDPNRFEVTNKPDRYVCFVGRFAKIKGPHTAIDVAAQAGLPIRIAGEVHPPERDFAASELEPRLKLPHVRFVGCVNVKQKVPLLRQARALLAPLDWNEPFGLILIEAMLSGCPVVAFPRGSATELIEPGITGFLAESAEEMVEVIREGGPLDSFDRRRCRLRAVQRFSRSRMVDDHVRLYERLLADKSEPETITNPIFA
jgi:glycosyltransferase involved in cell wall biosynthesis